ncbi:MAG: Rv2578c family radical SAM protein [Actinomycetes bacterium]
MRWDTLRLADDQPTPAARGPLPLLPRGAVTRQFDTPEFRGITFHEVTARSALNKVPEASRMPFRWTINPYRGCSHACVYCLAGDTQVQVADGRAKPLAALRVGDLVYGTERHGARRRYVRTPVLAHWRTVKPAYRVSLADGTSLVASGDHRFLTERGWTYVTGARQGAGRRPYLTTDDRLLGIGALVAPPTCGLEGAALESDARLGVVAIDEIGLDVPMFDITTGTGDFIANGVVSHNCFARKTHEYLELDAGHDFDSQIVVKTNVAEVLRRELARPSWRGEHVAMGTNVDCYQRAEGRYRLMPEILTALTDAANPFSILTKGALLLRDLPLLEAAAEVTDVSAAVSVGFLDEDVWRTVEPGTPPPLRRLEMCAALNDAGIPAGVLLAPVLPYLTDSEAQLRRAVAAAAAAGARYVSPIVLHLRPGAREWWQAWLRREHPDLVPRYQALYGERSTAPRSYQSGITATVRRIADEHGVGRSTMLRPAGRERLRRSSSEARVDGRRVAEATQLTLL